MVSRLDLGFVSRVHKLESTFAKFGIKMSCQTHSKDGSEEVTSGDHRSTSQSIQNDENMSPCRDKYAIMLHNEFTAWTPVLLNHMRDVVDERIGAIRDTFLDEKLLLRKELQTKSKMLELMVGSLEQKDRACDLLMEAFRHNEESAKLALEMSKLQASTSS